MHGGEECFPKYVLWNASRVRCFIESISEDSGDKFEKCCRSCLSLRYSYLQNSREIFMFELV